MAISGAALAQTVDVPRVTPGMRTPDYWISRHRAPDRLVMSPEEIKAFNKRTIDAGLIEELSVFPEEYDGYKLQIQLQSMLDGLKHQRLYMVSGALAGEDLYASLQKKIAIDAVAYRVIPRRAFVTTFTDQRLVPMDEPLYEAPRDVDFDQVQNSGLDPSTPVMVLHQTADGKWLYVKDMIAGGWVHADAVAFVDERMWKMFWQDTSSVVVTAARTLVWSDAELRGPLAALRMGTRLMATKFTRGVVEVLYPQRGVGGKVFWTTAFMKRADVTPGSLPYTARNIYTQAFKMLDAPYGWGDVHQRQDCSRFTQMVFATVGLILPRNSAEQGQTGSEVPLPEAMGAATLLRLNGHVMLYLGRVDQRLYAIHDVWAYRENVNGRDVLRPLKRVVVSDLLLGEGSSKGSLMERLVAVRSLAK